MVVIVTVSGFGQKAEVFHRNVISAIKSDTTKFHSINWHQSFPSQKLADLFDTRETKKIVIDVSAQLLEIINNSDRDEVVIISNSAGSMITELALSALPQINTSNEITHIMLAPAISGSELANWGKLAASIIATGIGLQSVKNLKDQKSKVIAGIFTSAGLLSLLSDKTPLSTLSQSIQEMELDLAEIERHIIYSLIDEIVKTPPTSIENAKYYYGKYSHTETTSVTADALEQKYTIKDTNKTIKKSEILDRAIKIS